jgi:glycosyltransferase involved in cell wall biosynthesis
MPKYSVLVPALNEEKYIYKLLDSLVDQTLKDFEVIVVDGKSKDKTQEVVNTYKEKLDLTLLVSEVRGPAYQRNLAASKARADMLLFLDADVIVGNEFIQKIDKLLSEKTVDVFTCWNKPLSNNFIDKAFFHLFNVLYLETHKYFKPGAVGTFIGVKRSVFETLGGFGNDIVLAEDFEFIRRANKAKYKYGLIRNPPVYTSTRRLEKEGRTKIAFKAIYADIYMLLRGPIKNPDIVRWELGNHD